MERSLRVDTLRFHHAVDGMLGLPQYGALHSTGSFRLVRTGFSHNIYSAGFGGTQLSNITVSAEGGDLVLAADSGVSYRIQPTLGGPVTVAGARMCLLTSGSVDLASQALVDDVPTSLPCNPPNQPYSRIGFARSSVGIKGKPGVDNLIVFTEGVVEGHIDDCETHDRNSDNVYVRVADAHTYRFQMRQP